MLCVNGTDTMLHASDFEYFNLPFFPECNLEEYCNNLSGSEWKSIIDEWESPSSEDPSNALLSYENENLHDDIYSLVDPDHFYKSDSDEAIVMTGEYHVLNEHAYSSVMTLDLPSPFVDIWNSSDDMHRQAPPVNPIPSRRNTRRTRKARKVSINTAAKAALKRTQWTRPSHHKRRKIENSVETTPSSSDYEDARSRNRDAKCTAIRAINGFNSNTKAVKSEVQRTNHNRNEKKRREVMSNMMKKVRYLVPAEFYRERTEKGRAKASKQKILVACEAYIHHLKKTEAENAKLIRKEKKEIVIKHRRLLKQFEQLQYKIECIAGRSIN